MPHSSSPAAWPASESRSRTQAQGARRQASAVSSGSAGTPRNGSAPPKEFLALPENRFCACGCGRHAEMVDHRIPHKGNPAPVLGSIRTGQPMTRACNSAKAAREEGAFGNRRRGVSPASEGETSGPGGSLAARSSESFQFGGDR